MKRLRLTIAFIIIFLAAAHVLAAPQYVASMLRQPFHFVTCRSAMNINPSNAVYFETRQKAIEAGHRPCKLCKP